MARNRGSGHRVAVSKRSGAGPSDVGVAARRGEAVYGTRREGGRQRPWGATYFWAWDKATSIQLPNYRQPNRAQHR